MDTYKTQKPLFTRLPTLKSFPKFISLKIFSLQKNLSVEKGALSSLNVVFQAENNYETQVGTFD